jgi:hypothetical protein
MFAEDFARRILPFEAAAAARNPGIVSPPGPQSVADSKYR